MGGGGKGGGGNYQPTVLPPAPAEPDTSWTGYLNNMGVYPNPPSQRGTTSKRMIAEDKLEKNNTYAKIDTLWGDRMKAEEQAIVDIDAELAKEAQNARVLGVDYSISDADRMQRIQKKFGSFWDPSKEDQLSAYVRKWGNPEQSNSERELIQKGKKKYEWNWDINILGSTPSPSAEATNMEAGGGGQGRNMTKKQVGGPRRPSLMTGDEIDEDRGLGGSRITSILGGR